jgi:hypothetical protein
MMNKDEAAAIEGSPSVSTYRDRIENKNNGVGRQ